MAMWVFPKIGGNHPKMDGLQWKTLLKWMIWGGPPLFLEGHPAIICRMFIISTSCPLGCCSTKWAVLQNMFKLSRIKVSPKIPLIWRCSQVHTTLPPTIMEVENGGLEDDWLVSKGAIFHFHDYGRKSIQTK